MTSLLNLLAAIALLVWGTHIVRTGVLRVLGADLRQVLRRSVSHRLSAFAAGIGVTSLLQSSTATAMLVSGFAGAGLVGTAGALAVMLGADVGTALVAQVLSLRIGWLGPLFTVVGVVVYLSRRHERAGQVGKILLGVGVMMLALQLIVQATAPLAHAAGVKVLFEQLTGDAALDVLVGALLAIAAWSGLAVVLLTASLADAHVITVPVALAIVVGANIGSGALAVVASLKSDAASRRAPIGNLVFRLIGALLTVPLLGFAPDLLARIGAAPAAMTVNFHLAFNLLLAATFIGLTGPAARLLDRWLPAPPASDAPGQPRHLDPNALATPALAIGAAAREAIRLADVVQEMLEGLLAVLKTDDFALAERLRKRDDEIDRLYTAIKLYLTQVSREALEPDESKRWADIIQFTINMEHAGDIIERMLIDIAEKKIAHGLSFSAAGMAEIEDLNLRLVANLKLAVTVFLHGELKNAQRLIDEKVSFRELEMRYADTHLLRLSDNTPQSIETSSLHLDLLSDYKRINSLFCSVAYPILEQAGVLAPTRVLPAAPQPLPAQPRHGL